MMLDIGSEQRSGGGQQVGIISVASIELCVAAGVGFDAN